MPLNRVLYTLIWLVALPAVLLRLAWRARRESGYAHDVAQRLGRFRVAPAASTLWIHAVSVGETRAAQPLIAALRQAHPDARILLTQTTATGRATAQALYGDTVALAWLPWDLPWAQRAFLRAWRPAIGILMETELWPNLIAECRRVGVPVVLANARLSDRSARRYARMPALAGTMLDALSGIAAQTAADAARLTGLGARNVTVTGNLKFDVAPSAVHLALGTHLRDSFGKRRVLLAASTRAIRRDLEGRRHRHIVRTCLGCRNRRRGTGFALCLRDRHAEAYAGDPAFRHRMGLAAMHARFGYPGLFAAYHAGPGRYAQFLAGRPLPPETRLYVARIVALLAGESPGPGNLRAGGSAADERAGPPVEGPSSLFAIGGAQAFAPSGGAAASAATEIPFDKDRIMPPALDAGAATDPRGDGNILSAQQPPSSLHEPPQRDRLFALPPRR